jgi:hypothetical protein
MNMRVIIGPRPMIINRSTPRHRSEELQKGFSKYGSDGVYSCATFSKGKGHER